MIIPLVINTITLSQRYIRNVNLDVFIACTVLNHFPATSSFGIEMLPTALNSLRVFVICRQILLLRFANIRNGISAT
jgi:hypothetical protein